MLTNNFELIDLLHKTIWWILDLIFALKYVMRWSFIILLFHNTWTFQKKKNNNNTWILRVRISHVVGDCEGVGVIDILSFLELQPLFGESFL